MSYMNQTKTKTKQHKEVEKWKQKNLNGMEQWKKLKHIPSLCSHKTQYVFKTKYHDQIICKHQIITCIGSHPTEWLFQSVEKWRPHYTFFFVLVMFFHLFESFSKYWLVCCHTVSLVLQTVCPCKGKLPVKSIHHLFTNWVHRTLQQQFLSKQRNSHERMMMALTQPEIILGSLTWWRETFLNQTTKGYKVREACIGVFWQQYRTCHSLTIFTLHASKWVCCGFIFQNKNSVCERDKRNSPAHKLDKTPGLDTQLNYHCLLKVSTSVGLMPVL